MNEFAGDLYVLRNMNAEVCDIRLSSTVYVQNGSLNDYFRLFRP